MRRFRHVILILTGRASAAAIAIMEFDMAFEKTAAAIEDLKAARDRVVAALQVPAVDTNAVDEATAAAISDVTSSLDAAIPAPPSA